MGAWLSNLGEQREGDNGDCVSVVPLDPAARLLREAHEVSGLPSPEFADRLGIQPSHLRRWESGQAIVPGSVLLQALQMAGVSLSTLHVQALLDFSQLVETCARFLNDPRALLLRVLDLLGEH
jgi:transcriptional regulator with XRE-family HTH domain